MMDGAHYRKRADEVRADGLAINAISIADEVLWSLPPATYLRELTSNPFGSRVCGCARP